MNFEQLSKISVGSYFIDKYDLDSENSYIRVFRIYRLNDIIRISKKEDVEYKFLCTMLSICSEENKKTVEKNIIECGISNVELYENGFENSELFNEIHKSDKETWDNTTKEILSIICGETHTKISLDNYCETCKNKETENCRFCQMKGNNLPSCYQQNN